MTALTAAGAPHTHVRSTPALSQAEVVSLQRQIEAGVLARERLSAGGGELDASQEELQLLTVLGERARQRFIGANLGLVGMVSRRYAVRSGLVEQDLFQEGCLGLMAAVERFDFARGLRFSTYALFWIRAYVSTAAARYLGAVNLPASRAEQLRAARGVEVELTQQLGRVAAVAEVATALGRSEAWTAALLAHRPAESLDALGGEPAEQAGPRYSIDQALEVAMPGRELLDRLADLPRAVLELRLGFADGEPRSLAHTARALGLSVGRVRRIEERALERLREVCPQQASAYL